ncbi:TolC family protein [Novosphingobium sp. SL115]|uniref:TolC family protein n=1 Tax=Novosphingobium sp. SL115 TaxID=2995150 RepID=UPI0022758309|nr:TolC family protein [Novosphingobium sp. SL115]MCY1672082.1 TolC family protein [Novosphingobium sp. SL115]
MHRIIAASLAVTPCAVLAQTPADLLSSVQSAQAVLTLEQAIAAAGGSAPSAQAAQAGIDAAHAARTVAGLRPNPSVETQVENFAGSGGYRAFKQAETTINFNIPLELGRKRSARIALADAQTSRAMLTAAITQADIRLQVSQLYIDAIAAQRRAVTAADQLRIAGEAFRAASIRVQAGRASPIEEQRADVARINAEAGVERARRLLAAARMNLARRIGLPMEVALDPGALDILPPPIHGPTEFSAEGTLAMAAADADLAVADAGVRMARSQRVPDIAFGPGLRRLAATNDTAAVFSISVPLPLFNSGGAAVEQAQAQRGMAEAQRRMTALDVEQAITDARAEADNAATSARAASGPALAAAQEAARIARIGYREGKFGQIDLLDAERTLAETRVAAIDALAAYQNAKARLERLIAPAPQEDN